METTTTTIEQLENGTVADKIIEIKAIYKTTKFTVQPAFDPSQKWWAGVKRLSEEQKKDMDYFIVVGETSVDRQHLNTKITLRDGLTFDLNNDIDKINWEWVKHCPQIAMSFADAQSSKALFYVHIEGRESEMRTRTVEKRFEAVKLVVEDAATNYVNRALLLGVDMETAQPGVIKDFLLEVAEKTPDKIFRVYRDKAMKVHLLYLKGKKAGIIKVDHRDNVITYASTILGISDESAITYLQNNEDILMLVERDVNPSYFEAKGVKAPEVKTERPLTPIEKAQAARKFKEETKE
jgi:hypothetical protein